MRTTEFVCFCGISERWYKACLRSVTASSGHSRPSGGSTLTKWNPALDPAEGFGTEGKRTRQTMPSTDRLAAAAAVVSSLPGQPLAFVPLWPQSFSRKQWAVLHWKQPGVAPCWVGFFVYTVNQGIGFCWCRSVGGRSFGTGRQITNIINWSSILFPSELGPGMMTSSLSAYVINTEDPN